jgi:DNA-binding XRE family transcriptional regulator
LKLTQAQLAERLGVQTVTIKSIENGAFKISARLALALASLLNLDYQDIMANKRSILKDALQAMPLDKWDQLSRTVSDVKLEFYRSRISDGVGDLLRAARDYAPIKLVSLISAFYSALDDIAEEFGLEKALKRFEKARPRAKWVRLHLRPVQSAAAARKPGRQRASPGGDNGS